MPVYERSSTMPVPADELYSWHAGPGALASLVSVWTAGRRREILGSRLQSTGLLARAAAGMARPPRVVVSASAIGYYGSRGAEELTEDSAPGSGFLADVCRQWEEALAPARKAGIRWLFPDLEAALRFELGR